ncbi:MAG: hypothetical protein AAF557_17125 [Pseudomonadota bacterium]
MVEKRRTSPSYPSVDLRDAIDLVGKVFDADRSYPIDREVAAKNMGFSGLTGRSMSILASLLQYRLLDKLPESQVKVSQTAVDILYPESPLDRSQAIQIAANGPKLFAELNEKFEGHMPSEENLSAFLLRKGFLDRALSPVIRSFVKTMEFVRGEQAAREETTGPTSGLEYGQPSDKGVSEISQLVEVGALANPGQDNSSTDSSSLRQDVFTVEEGSVTMIWPKKLSAESFEDISDWLEILLRKMKRSIE